MPTIAMNSTELQLECFWKIRWDEVQEISAWKDDVLAYDIICVGFRTTNDDHYYRVDEECVGWDRLTKELESRFGIRRSDWWSRVAFPAFATNHTLLWGRPTVCVECGYDLRASQERCPECGTPIPTPVAAQSEDSG